MKQMMKRLSLILLGVFCLASLMCACSPEPQPNEKESISGPPDGYYRIYTVNKSGTKLSAYDEDFEEQSVWELIETLLMKVKEAPNVVGQNSAMPANLYVQRYQLSERVLYLYFDGNYREMSPVNEVLCRAALAKTMTQIEGVDYISIYVDDQPLMDATGTPIGYVTSSDFIERFSDVEDTTNVSTVTLYFTDKSGTKLVAETRELTSATQSTSMERRIVNALLEGPKEKGNYPTIPSTVKVNSVQVKNNICYVNLDATFINAPLNISEYIPVYSLVNSLTELQTISSVQIMIDGNSAVTFRGSISFENPLVRNLDYIEK